MMPSQICAASMATFSLMNACCVPVVVSGEHFGETLVGQIRSGGERFDRATVLIAGTYDVVAPLRDDVVVGSSPTTSRLRNSGALMTRRSMNRMNAGMSDAFSSRYSRGAPSW
jgi:hypothetical protein